MRLIKNDNSYICPDCGSVYFQEDIDEMNRVNSASRDLFDSNIGETTKAGICNAGICLVIGNGFPPAI